MVKKFNMARINSSDRNVKASVENIKQQTYVNNIENKKKINEIIDEIDSNETSTATEIADIKDRLDTDEGNISTNTGDISDLGDAIDEITTYATTEKRVGTWIDGKPLYRKVQSITIPTTTDGTLVENTTAHSISDVDTIFISDSYFKESGGYNYMLPICAMGTQYKVRCEVSDTYVKTYTNLGFASGWNGYVSLLYTKTTD